MSVRFTKGPWFTDPDADLMVSEPSVYCMPPEPLFDSQNITIATVTAYHAYISNDEAKANAALIAAAPELFAMLEAVALSGKLPLGLYASVKKVMQKARGVK